MLLSRGLRERDLRAHEFRTCMRLCSFVRMRAGVCACVYACVNGRVCSRALMREL